MKKWKNALVLLLAVALLFGSVPTKAFAEPLMEQTQVSEDAEKQGEIPSQDIAEAPLMEVTADEQPGEEASAEEEPAEEAPQEDLLTDERLTEEAPQDTTDIPERMGGAQGKRGLGYQPVDFRVDTVDYSALSEKMGGPEELLDAYVPDALLDYYLSYTGDSFENNPYVSSVKDQGNWGTCWSFSALACAESAYMRRHSGNQIDLSEKALAKFTYNRISHLGGDCTYMEDYDFADLGYGDITDDYFMPQRMGGEGLMQASKAQRGGNTIFTINALSKWYGVVREDRDASLVYPEDDGWGTNPAFEGIENTNMTDIPGEFYRESDMHLQNVRIYPMSERKNGRTQYYFNDDEKREVTRNTIKQALKKYNCLSVAFFWSQDFAAYDYACRTYNYYTSEVDYSNHAVALVGWDDHYPKERFVTEPENDGAWIIKNSWGNADNTGFLYISYEDTGLNSQNFFALDFEDADNYDHIYQYDGGAGFQTGRMDAAAAVFTVPAYAAETHRGDVQEVEAVGVLLGSADATYNVEVFKNPDPTSPNYPACNASGDTTPDVVSILRSDAAGFYTTVALSGSPSLSAGESFSVVVTPQEEDADKREIGYDSSFNNGWCGGKVKVNTGETFIYDAKRGKWADGKGKNLSVKIKAYTKDSVHSSASILLKEDMVSVADCEYTGTEVIPDVSVRCNGRTLQSGASYTITYQNNVDISATAPTVTITGVPPYLGTVTKTFEIQPRTLTADMVSVSDAVFNATPQLDVAVSGVSGVVKDQDYTVTYQKQPIEAGTYSVTVTGQGKLKGVVKKTAQIAQLDLENDDVVVTLQPETAAFTGKAVKPTVVLQVQDADGELHQIDPKHYSLIYQNNVSPTDAATVRILAKAKGSLKGDAEKGFTIAVEPTGLHADAGKIGTLTYTGKPLMPKPIVSYRTADAGITLKEGTDYELNYEDHTDAGVARVTVSGKGLYADCDDKVVTYNIQPLKVAARKVSAEPVIGTADAAVMYNGMRVAATDYQATLYEPNTETAVSDAVAGQAYDIQLAFKHNYEGILRLKAKSACAGISDYTVDLSAAAPLTYTGKAQKLSSIKLLDDTNTEIPAANYTVTYRNNVNAGLATVTLTGNPKKGYTGSISENFVIAKKAVDVSGVAIADVVYNGAEQKPKVTVRGAKVGREFKVTYQDNVNVAYASDADADRTPIRGAGAVLTPAKNYQLQENGADIPAKTVPFRILPAVITAAKCQDLYYDRTNANNQATPALYAGKLAVPAENFSALTYAGTGSVSTRASRASVTVSGLKKDTEHHLNYKFKDGVSEMTAQYSLNKKPMQLLLLEGATDLPFAPNWAGKPIARKHAVSALMIYDTDAEGNKLGSALNRNDFTITYRKNTTVGTATIELKPNRGSTADQYFTGSFKQTFRITPMELDNSSMMVALASSAYYYNGKEIKPKVQAIRVRSPYTYNHLLPKDYQLSYRNHVNAGAAEMVITMKGNYSGTITVPFTIKKNSLNNAVVTMKPTAAPHRIPDKLVVKLAGKLLKPVRGKDYYVTLHGADSVGNRAYVEIIGIGNFTGMKRIYYTVSEM